MRMLMAMAMAAVLSAALPADAQERALPAFEVQAPSGQAVASSALAPQEKWLLIYVSSGCRACETLVRALPKWQSAALLGRTVLVVGGAPEAAAAWVQRLVTPELPTMLWYGDASREAEQALALSGAPVLIGVQKGEVEWQLSGVLNSPAALESVIRSWVERP